MTPCNHLTNETWGWRCLRWPGHPDSCIDHELPTCEAPWCEQGFNLTLRHGPAQPVHLDGGTAWLHRACADALARERAALAAERAGRHLRAVAS